MLDQTMKLLASIREFAGSNLGRVTNHPKVSAISSVHQGKFRHSTLKLTTTTSTYFPIHYSLFIHAVIRQYFFRSVTAPSGPGPPHCRGFKITPRHTTFSRTPLDERSPRHRDNLTKQHSQETDTHAPRRDSNPQSQQANGRRTTP